MNRKDLNQKNILMAVLAVLIFLIVVMSIVIALVINRNYSGDGGGSGGSNGGSSGTYIDTSGYEMAGTSEPIGLEEDYYEDGEQTVEDSARIDEWVSESADVREKIYDMSLSEAMSYIDGKIAEKADPDDAFNMQAIKINVLMNAEMYSQALEEANKITNVSQLSLWNQEEYYNTMHWIYEGLDNKEKADEYVDLWYKTYIRRTGGASGGYE